MNELAAALQDSDSTEQILAGFKERPPASPLAAETALIERCFAGGTVTACLDGLKAAADEGAALAKTALAAMLAKSPTSQAIALRQMQIGADLSFEEAMGVDYRIVSRICRGHDFYEGVRAVIVDKDNRPQWRLADAADVKTEDVDPYFAPLGPDDLVFPAAQT
jgi:enoyl-CoA hydratase